MKKVWRCPECGNLAEVLSCDIKGYCSLDTTREAKIEEWEIGNPFCEVCGFEEDSWTSKTFTTIEIED